MRRWDKALGRDLIHFAVPLGAPVRQAIGPLRRRFSERCGARGGGSGDAVACNPHPRRSTSRPPWRPLPVRTQPSPNGRAGWAMRRRRARRAQARRRPRPPQAQPPCLPPARRRRGRARRQRRRAAAARAQRKQRLRHSTGSARWRARRTIRSRPSRKAGAAACGWW